MKITLSKVLATAMSVTVLLVVGSGIKVKSAKPYNLWVALALTGTGQTYSKDGIDAIRLAVNEINAQGGLRGKHLIKLFVRDTRTSPAEAVLQTRGLIETDKVRAVLGTYSSACAQGIKPICRQAKVLHIAGISNAEDITRTDFSPYTFSVVPNTYMQASAVALGVPMPAPPLQQISKPRITDTPATGLC